MSEAVSAPSWDRKRYVLPVLSFATMFLPDNEPLNITFVQADEKYKCLYDKTSVTRASGAGRTWVPT